MNTIKENMKLLQGIEEYTPLHIKYAYESGHTASLHTTAPACVSLELLRCRYL